MITRYIAPVLIIGMFASCGTSGNKMNREERLQKIKEAEDKSFGQGGEFNAQMAAELITLYAAFAEENPDDTESPNYLFKAGDISMGLEKSEEAIKYFQEVIDYYPDFEKVPYCMFLIGFIYENQIEDLNMARTAYVDFIEKYPDHDMTESAKFSLRNLGKSPEELIREFESGKTNTEGS